MNQPKWKPVEGIRPPLELEATVQRVIMKFNVMATGGTDATPLTFPLHQASERLLTVPLLERVTQELRQHPDFQAHQQLHQEMVDVQKDLNTHAARLAELNGRRKQLSLGPVKGLAAKLVGLDVDLSAVRAKHDAAQQALATLQPIAAQRRKAAEAALQVITAKESNAIYHQLKERQHKELTAFVDRHSQFLTDMAILERAIRHALRDGSAGLRVQGLLNRVTDASKDETAPTEKQQAGELVGAET